MYTLLNKCKWLLSATCFTTLLGCSSPMISEVEQVERTASSIESRTVAITVDDVPTIGVYDFADKQQLTEKLLAKLTQFNVPAVGFVNEQQIDHDEDKTRSIALLKSWVDAGMELGNHTYSHPKFFDTSLAEYKQQVLRGEQITKTLFTPKANETRYFRHPYLNTGPDMATRLAFEEFLQQHNYQVAPVTIDNSEWIYAKAYTLAKAAGDKPLQQRIGEDYVNYMLREFDFYEAFSVELFDRELAQVLLIHANQLNADYLDQLLMALSARGYRFVTLKKALEDPAYQHTDSYVGPRGVSWLQRWWFSEGNEFKAEPKVSGWINDIAFAK